MVATFQWSKTYGPSGGPTIEDIGASGNAFNFMDEDSNTEANYSTKPITASDAADAGRSYECWIRGHLTGTFNTVDNIQFWESTDFAPDTGLQVYWKGDTVGAYVTPIKLDSLIALSTVPVADPGTANVTIGGSLGGSLTSAGWTDYIVLQLDVGTTAAAGDTSLATYTMQYDES